MKKQEKGSRRFGGRHQQRFVLKKFNKQLLRVMGVTLLLLGNYLVFPLQVFSEETVTNSSEVQGSLATTLSNDDQLNTTDSTISQPTTPAETPPPEAFSSEPAEQSSETTESSSSEVQTDSTSSQEQPTKQRASFNSEWDFTDNGPYVELIEYLGDPTNITVPSVIDDKPVQIDLEKVLGTYFEQKTQTFSIENSRQDLAPVKVTGTFRGLFANVVGEGIGGISPIQTVSFGDSDTSEI